MEESVVSLAKAHLRVARPTDNLTEVVSFYPYWDKQGKTFEDPDGYRVVLQNAPLSA